MSEHTPLTEAHCPACMTDAQIEQVAEAERILAARTSTATADTCPECKHRLPHDERWGCKCRATVDTGLRERVEALRDHAQTKAEATEPAQPWRWIGKRLTEALNATAAPTTDTGARGE